MKTIQVIQINFNTSGSTQSGPMGLKNFNTRQKAGSFYRIKNTEQVREKQKMNKQQRSKQRGQSWPGIWGLADWIYCVSGQAEHFQDHESYLGFGFLTRQQDRSGSILGLEIYFSMVMTTVVVVKKQKEQKQRKKKKVKRRRRRGKRGRRKRRL